MSFLVIFRMLWLFLILSFPSYVLGVKDGEKGPEKGGAVPFGYAPYPDCESESPPNILTPTTSETSSQKTETSSQSTSTKSSPTEEPLCDFETDPVVLSPETSDTIKKAQKIAQTVPNIQYDLDFLIKEWGPSVPHKEALREIRDFLPAKNRIFFPAFSTSLWEKSFFEMGFDLIPMNLFLHTEGPNKILKELAIPEPCNDLKGSKADDTLFLNCIPQKMLRKDRSRTSEKYGLPVEATEIWHHFRGNYIVLIEPENETAVARNVWEKYTEGRKVDTFMGKETSLTLYRRIQKK